ncbi:MAG: hypothetical protein J6Y10_01105 [Lachnospiraceae bacterium]|nr:hypothetical protein [Lachnospiraceae bacterium]
MHRNDGLARKSLLCVMVLAAALLFAMMPHMLKAARAEGDEPGGTTTDINTDDDIINKQQYLNGYYEGTVTKDGSSVRALPGTKDENGKTKNDIVKTSAGKQVILNKGDKVKVYGERRDSDKDTWYHIQCTVGEEVITGYVYSGRVTRENTQITFTPTPTETPEATPTTAVPTSEEKQNELKSATPTPQEQTKDMAETAKKEPWTIWKLLFILGAAFITFVLIYMIVNHYAEKKIDEEMRHAPDRDYTLPHLEGESDEDYERERRKARKKEVARDFKDQRKRNMTDELELDADQIGEIDDFSNFTINMDGVFDDDSTRKAVSAAVTEAVSEDAREQSSAAGRAETWSASDAKLVRNLSDHADEQEKELIRQIAPEYAQPKKPAASAPAGDEEEITFTPEEMVLRRKLDQLKEQDVLVHKKRGVGEVIDNSDPNIIQVRFDRDLRFLKKDKLVKKHLVDL